MNNLPDSERHRSDSGRVVSSEMSPRSSRTLPTAARRRGSWPAPSGGPVPRVIEREWHTYVDPRRHDRYADVADAVEAIDPTC